MSNIILLNYYLVTQMQVTISTLVTVDLPKFLDNTTCTRSGSDTQRLEHKVHVDGKIKELFIHA
jgi:hypothetical protein